MAALGKLRSLPERVHIKERRLELSQLDGRDAKRPDVTQLIVSTLQGHSCHLWSHPVGRDPQRARSGPGTGERWAEGGGLRENGTQTEPGEDTKTKLQKELEKESVGTPGIRAL